MKRLFKLSLNLLLSWNVWAATTGELPLSSTTVPIARPSAADLERILVSSTLPRGLVMVRNPSIVAQAKALFGQGLDPRGLPLFTWQKVAFHRPDVAGALLVDLRYSPGYVHNNSAAIMAALPKEEQIKFRRAKLEADARRAIEVALSTESDHLPSTIGAATSISDFLVPALTTYTATETPAGTITRSINPKSTFIKAAFEQGIRDSAWGRRGPILVAQNLDPDGLAEARASEAAASKAHWQSRLNICATRGSPVNNREINVWRWVITSALQHGADLRDVPLTSWIPADIMRNFLVLDRFTEIRYSLSYARSQAARLLPGVETPTDAQLMPYTTFTHPATHAGILLGPIGSERRALIMPHVKNSAWQRRRAVVAGSVIEIFKIKMALLCKALLPEIMTIDPYGLRSPEEIRRLLNAEKARA